MESTEHVSVLPPPPSKVYVGSFEFVIKAVARGSPELNGEHDCEGTTDFDPTEICYDPSRPPRQVFDTIWHEITHAVNHAFGLDFKGCRNNTKREEHVATVHGKAWTQVFLDNPALIEWLDLATNFIKSEQENVSA